MKPPLIEEVLNAYSDGFCLGLTHCGPGPLSIVRSPDCNLAYRIGQRDGRALAELMRANGMQLVRGGWQ
jgi:hypothetical protein